jgi:hypothetical protein
MRFEVSERLRTGSSPVEILPVIEAQFRKISSKVTRSGEIVTATAIESTFGSINRRTAAIVALRKDSDSYLITADVTYSPSVAFWIFEIIGVFTWVLWILPLAFYLGQKKSVRSAIEGCLKRVKDEFDQQNIASTRKPETMSIDDIEKLAVLKEKGLISDIEFEAKKKQILGL